VHWSARERDENMYKISVRKPEGHLEDLSVNGRIILK
jgi:hypothetical protein